MQTHSIRIPHIPFYHHKVIRTRERGGVCLRTAYKRHFIVCTVGRVDRLEKGQKDKTKTRNASNAISMPGI